MFGSSRAAVSHQLTDKRKQDAPRHDRTQLTGSVRPHCVHQNKVVEIFLLGNPRRQPPSHGESRNAGRANQG